MCKTYKNTDTSLDISLNLQKEISSAFPSITFRSLELKEDGGPKLRPEGKPHTWESLIDLYGTLSFGFPDAKASRKQVKIISIMEMAQQKDSAHT